MKVVPVLIVWFFVLLLSAFCFTVVGLNLLIGLGGEAVRVSLPAFVAVGIFTLICSIIGACVLHDTI